jgi:hypothetical protein
VNIGIEGYFPTMPDSGILNSGKPQLMHRVRTSDLLDALKACLRELENRQLLHPDNLAIIDRKQTILEQIAALEREKSDGHMTAA